LVQTALTYTEFNRFSGLTMGKVYDVHSEANMVDVLLMDGSKLTDVQVLTPYASSSHGITNLPISKYAKNMLDKDLPSSSARQDEWDVFAVVGFLGGSILRPVVLGFLFPEENESLCGRDDQPGNKDGSQYLFKHKSNVYSRIDQDGQIEISHPSGLFIKIGKDCDLTTITNWDTKLRPFNRFNPVSKEADPAPYVYISHPSGNTLMVNPDGDVTEHIVGNVVRTIHGNLTETIDGDIVRDVGGDETNTIVGILTDKAKKIVHTGS